MNKRLVKNTLFAIAAIIVIICFIISCIISNATIKDCIFVFCTIIFFFFFERGYALPIPLIIAGLIPMVLDPISVMFGFYDWFLFGIGYDKFVHFSFTFLGSLVIFYLLKTYFVKSKITTKNLIVITLCAFFIVNGIGVLGKLIEYTGSKYFHFSGATMFSMDAGAVPPNAIVDLVVDRSWWALLFNFFGTAAAGIVLFLVNWKSYKKIKTLKRKKVYRP